MKYLITGGSGFIGRHLIEYLKERSHEAVPFARHNHMYAEGVFVGSVNSYQNIERAIRQLKPDCIVHLAAYGNNSSHNLDREILKTNVLGTQYTLEGAIKNNVPRFIHISTSSVYPKSSTFKEYEATGAESMYALSKVQSEQVVEHYSDKISTFIFRPFTIYGHYEAPNRLTKVAIDAIKNEKPFNLVEEAVHDWTYVGDFCTAVEQMSRRTEEGYSNFGTGIPTSNKQLVEHLEEIIGKKALYKPIKDFWHFRGHDSKRWKADTALMERLGLQTYTSLQEGLTYICQ